MLEVDIRQSKDGRLVIGNDESRASFLGKARVGIRAEALKSAAARGEDVAGRYFLFAHAKAFDPETVALCREHGVTPVSSIKSACSGNFYADRPVSAREVVVVPNRPTVQSIERFR